MRSPRLAASLTGSLIALATVAGPAFADTLVVDPGDANNACTRGADNTCKTITQAVSAAQTGDTINVLKGTYAESPTLPAGKSGIVLKGAGLADTKIVGSGATDVLTVAGDSDQVSDLAIEVPGGAQSALAITGIDATVIGVLMNRTAGGNEPAVDVTAGPLRLDRSFVIQKSGTGSVGISSSGDGGVKLADTLVASFQGPALAISGAVANAVVRSTIVSAAAGANAIEIVSGASSTTSKALRSDSSFIAAPGAGIDATSQNPGSGFSTAGPIAIDIRHSTISAAKGLVLDASAAQGTLILPPTVPLTFTSPGSITATVRSSIVHGSSTVDRNASGTGGNTASLTFSDSDAPPPSSRTGASFNQPQFNTPNDKLFVPGKLFLRADAPVIDKGGEVASEDSQTDVAGDPRVVGGRSDIGADEFLNLPPKAALTATNGSPRENELIGFSSGSIDPESKTGGSITEYRWTFGDGSSQTTTYPFVGHTYTTAGVYKATLVVMDNFGAVSASSAPVTITVGVGDLAPPVVTVAKPAEGAKLRLNRTYRTKSGAIRQRKPLAFRALGTAVDPSGIQKVQVAITLVKRDRISRKTATSSVGTCEQFGGRTFKKMACGTLKLIGATVKGNQWSFRTKPGVRLPAGRYELRVRAVDKIANVASAFTKAAHTLVSFRVK